MPTPPTSWSFLLGHRDNFYCVQLLSKHFYQNPNSILENILNILNMVHGHHDMPLLFAVHFINKRMDSIFQIQQRPNFCPIFDENSCAHHCSSIFHLVTEAISLPISTVRSDFLKETFTSRLMMKGSMNTQPKLCIIKTFHRKGNIITFQIQNNISQDIWKKLFLSLRRNDFCHQILF